MKLLLANLIICLRPQKKLSQLLNTIKAENFSVPNKQNKAKMWGYHFKYWGIPPKVRVTNVHKNKHYDTFYHLDTLASASR